jgi:hypothetical protein
MTTSQRVAVRYVQMDEPIGDLHSESLNDVVHRLFGEFRSDVSLAAVAITVRRCRRELDVVTGPALPEMVERLARQRLANHRGRG